MYGFQQCAPIDVTIHHGTSVLLTLSHCLWASVLSQPRGIVVILISLREQDYNLALPHGVGIHPIYHINRLKPILDFHDDTIPVNDLVKLEDLSYKPHVPKQILDSRTKFLHSTQIHQFQIKWMDKPVDDATQEQEHTLNAQFSHFILQQCNVEESREYVMYA